MPYVRWRRLVHIFGLLRVYRCYACSAVHIRVLSRHFWLMGKKCCSRAQAGAPGAHPLWTHNHTGSGM